MISSGPALCSHPGSVLYSGGLGQPTPSDDPSECGAQEGFQSRGK